MLDRDAVAVTALSPTYPATELEEAKLYAAEIGIEHRLIETHELEKEEYAVNNPDRCFHCKKELFTEMQLIAVAEGFDTIVYGGIMDDLGDHRPGMEAAELLNARAPLVEAELQKSEIRQLSKELGLPTWNKPGGACLASRIPYGMRVTLEKLHQVDQAELFLHKLGFRLVRVRHHGDIARIEAPPEDLTPALRGRRPYADCHSSQRDWLQVRCARYAGLPLGIPQRDSRFPYYCAVANGLTHRHSMRRRGAGCGYE